jgi:hypothetical protein
MDLTVSLTLAPDMSDSKLGYRSTAASHPPTSAGTPARGRGPVRTDNIAHRAGILDYDKCL